MNHLRGQMAEFGVTAPKGPQHIAELVALLADPAQRRIPSPLSRVLLSMVTLMRAVDEDVKALEPANRS